MEKTEQPNITTESASPLPPPPAPTVSQPSPTSTVIALLASTATSHSFRSRTRARTRAMVSSTYQYLRVSEQIFSLNRLEYAPSRGCRSSGLFIMQTYQNYLFIYLMHLVAYKQSSAETQIYHQCRRNSINFQRRDNKARHFTFEITTLLKVSCLDIDNCHKVTCT